MIEVRLTENEALDYIRNENLTDVRLASVLQELDDLQTKYDISLKGTPKVNVSDTVLRQSSIAKEVNNTTPTGDNFRWYPGKKPSSHWSDKDVNIIEYAANRPKYENSRKISVLADKLGRSESSVRTKLHRLGYSIKKGKLVTKND